MPSSSPSSLSPEQLRVVRDYYVSEKTAFFERNPTAHFVPPHIMRGLDRYVQMRAQPGAFLTAVLENDLHSAVLYADEQALTNLHAVVIFVVNVLPVSIQGSPDKVNAWLSGGNGTKGDGS